MKNIENKVGEATERVMETLISRFLATCRYRLTARKLARVTQKVFVFFLIFTTVSSYFYGLVPTSLQEFAPEVKVAKAATMGIRQEINILDGYVGAASGSYGTSSARINLDSSKFNGGSTYYFEVVASTSAATNATIMLRNATSSATYATITVNRGNSYQLYRSSSFTVPTGAPDLVVVLGNEAIGKGAKVARVVILQSANPITTTQTQIEIGNQETGKSNTTSSALSAPKYWAYDADKWDGTLTAYAEVTFQNTQVSSSTQYNVSATTTATYYRYIGSNGVSYVTIEAWGAGGGGGNDNTGGGGGGGGAYVRSTTTVAAASVNSIGVGAGGARDTAGAAATASSTYAGANGFIAQAAGGAGTAGQTGGAGGTTANSTGQVEVAGGSGGNGHTTGDVGGGGGGAAGPDGVGATPANAAASAPTAGGRADNNLGGVGGAAGTTNTDTCSTTSGKAGANNDLGGGGGGGSGGDGTSVCTGGAGGSPGGGAGGADGGASEQVGGPGRVIIKETHGAVSFALEEDNGSFGSWTFKTMIATTTRGVATSTSARVRSNAFTPVDGRHYRIVASTTNASATYSVYNAKIIIDQTNNPTKLEAQYLLLNTSISSGTATQNYTSWWRPSEWVGVSNTYLHAVDSSDGATSVMVVAATSTDTTVTNSSITLGSPASYDQHATSTSALTMPVADDGLDAKATTNNNNVYGSRILVQVQPATTISGKVYQSEGGSALANGTTISGYKNGSTLIGNTTVTSGDGSWTLSDGIVSGDIVTIYINGDATYDGALVYVTDGTAKTDLNFYGGALVVRDDVGSGITNANLTTGYVSGDAADMVYTTDGSNNLTVSSGVELHVYTGDTYTPGATVTTQGTGDLHVDDSATVTLGSATNSIADDLNVDTGATININANTAIAGDLLTAGTASVAYSGTPTVTMSGTGTLGGGSNALTFYNLTVSGTVTGSNSMTVNNTLNVSGGSLVLSGGTATMATTGWSITNSGTLTFSGLTISETPSSQPTSSFSVGGALTVNASKTLAPTAGTITMTGGSIVNNNSLTFYNLTIAGTVTTSATFGVGNTMTSTSGTLTTSGGTITVTGDLSVAGTITGTGSVTVNGGDVTGNGTLNFTDGTFLLDGSGLFGGNTGWTFNKLTFGDGTGAATTYGQGTGSITSATTTVANNQTLDAGVAKSWTVSASHEPFQLQGAFLASSSSFYYTASNNATVTPTTYYNLEIAPSSGSPTIKLATTTGQTITVNNNFTINGAGNATVDANTRDPILDVNGNFSIGNGDTFQASNSSAFTLAGNFTDSNATASGFTNNSGTLTLDSGNTSTISSTKSMTFYNLTSIIPGKTIKFQKHSSDIPTFSFDGLFTATGSSGNWVYIESDTPGNQWMVDFNIAQTAVTYASIKDSSCILGSLSVVYSVTNSGRGNIGSCWNVGNTGAGGSQAVISTEQGSGGGSLQTGGVRGGGGGGTGGDGGSGGGSQQGGGGQGGGGGGGNPTP